MKYCATYCTPIPYVYSVCSYMFRLTFPAIIRESSFANMWNWCAVVGINKLIYVKQLHRMCIILVYKDMKFVLYEATTGLLNVNLLR
jgi:hypothetical protein